MFSAIPKQPNATPQRIDRRGRRHGLGRFRGQGIGPKEAAGRTAVPNKVLEADSEGWGGWRGGSSKVHRMVNFSEKNGHQHLKKSPSFSVGLRGRVKNFLGRRFLVWFRKSWESPSWHTCQPHSEVSAKQEMLEPCFL